jgi:hypothetical protein
MILAWWREGAEKRGKMAEKNADEGGEEEGRYFLSLYKINIF